MVGFDALKIGVRNAFNLKGGLREEVFMRFKRFAVILAMAGLVFGMGKSAFGYSSSFIVECQDILMDAGYWVRVEYVRDPEPKDPVALFRAIVEEQSISGPIFVARYFVEWKPSTGFGVPDVFRDEAGNFTLNVYTTGAPLEGRVPADLQTLNRENRQVTARLYCSYL